MAVFQFDPTKEEMVLDLAAYGYGPNDNVKLETVGEFIYDHWGNRADPLAANVMGRWEFLWGWTWSIREHGSKVRLSTRDSPVSDNESTGHFGAEMTRVLFSEFDDHVDLSVPI